MENLNVNIDVLAKTGESVNRFKIRGSGIVNKGVVRGIIRPIDKSSGFDPQIITAFCFTGCPIFANLHDGASNLWIKTGGEYMSTRNLDFGKHGVLISSLNAKREGNDINMQLTIWGGCQTSITLTC